MIKAKKIPIKNALFFTSYGIYLFATILSTSFYYKYIQGLPLQVLLVSSTVLLLAKELLLGKIYNKRFLLLLFVMVFMVILLLLSPSSMGYSSLLYLLLFVISGRDIDVRDISKFAFSISLLLFLFVILSARVGIIESYVSHSLKGEVHYLGFRYGLYASALYSNIVVLYLFNSKGDFKLFQAILLQLLNYYFFLYTNSRMSFVFVAAAIVIAFIFFILKKNNRENIVTSKALYPLSFIFVIAMLLSMVLIIMFNPHIRWMQFFDLLLEGRISFQKKMYTQYGIPLIGIDPSWVGNALNAFGKKVTGTYSFVDNLYYNMIIKYGLIVTVAFIVIITMAMKKIYHQKKYLLFFILCLCALDGIVEDQLLYLYNNTFLLIALSSFFKPLRPHSIIDNRNMSERLQAPCGFRH